MPSDNKVEVVIHKLDTYLLLQRSIWLLRERASGFINSLISSLVRPKGERCTAFALGLPRSPVHRIEISSERDRKPGMAAIKIQGGNFDAANRRGRSDGRANELRGGGYETHFGLGAKVDLIEFWPSVRPTVRQAVDPFLMPSLPPSRRFHISFFWRAQRGPSFRANR